MFILRLVRELSVCFCFQLQTIRVTSRTVVVVDVMETLVLKSDDNPILGRTIKERIPVYREGYREVGVPVESRYFLRWKRDG